MIIAIIAIIAILTMVFYNNDDLILIISLNTTGGAPAADAELARSKAPDQKRYNALVAKEELLQKQINGGDYLSN